MARASDAEDLLIDSTGCDDRFFILITVGRDIGFIDNTGWQVDVVSFDIDMGK